jgi:hypothetical protein
MSVEFNFWKGMIKKYWYALIIYGIALAGFISGVILVLIQYTGSPDIAGGGTWTLADFSVGSALLWIIFLILWEILIVLLPTIAYLAIVTVLFWFVIISEEDKTAIKGREKREKHKRKTRGGGGAANFIFFLAFLCVVTIEDHLWTTFGDENYVYYIFAYLRGIMWTFIVLGIPALIAGILYLVFKGRKTPETPEE